MLGLPVKTQSTAGGRKGAKTWGPGIFMLCWGSARTALGRGHQHPTQETCGGACRTEVGQGCESGFVAQIVPEDGPQGREGDEDSSQEQKQGASISDLGGGGGAAQGGGRTGAQVTEGVSKPKVRDAGSRGARGTLKGGAACRGIFTGQEVLGAKQTVGVHDKGWEGPCERGEPAEGLWDGR